MENNKLIISPKTKVLQLIETYPQLEEVLINYLPAFKKLKNPVLRKTVAKITTLQQASIVGNVKVEELINTLRREIGQETIEMASEVNYNTKQPAWFDLSKVKSELDVREMLNSGEQPVNQVISDLHKLKPGEIYKVTSSFIPAPLIDKALSLEIEHWVSKESDKLFVVYFIKNSK